MALEYWLSKLRENLTADASGTKIFLGKDSPETLSARLAQSKLGDPAVRKALWDGGMAAIQASDDPMIKFVLATDAASREVRKQYEERVSGPTDRAAQKIARARFAIYGTNVYPDATFTLRLSYGKVEGWTDNGVTVPPFTYYKGLWERATGQFPFDLAPRWQSAQSQGQAGTVLDFVSDNDIIGGNSGSPVINAKGEVVGAAFDGNIESLGGAFGFDDRVNRTVSVSTAAITEALAQCLWQRRRWRPSLPDGQSDERCGAESRVGDAPDFPGRRRGAAGRASARAADDPPAANEKNRSRLILLGTGGGPTPKPNRSAPSQVIVVNGASYVIDCGNGVARQMVLAGVPLASHPRRVHHPSAFRSQCRLRQSSVAELGRHPGDARRYLWSAAIGEHDAPVSRDERL